MVGRALLEHLEAARWLTAFVVTSAMDAAVETCGMQLFGVPDAHMLTRDRADGGAVAGAVAARAALVDA